MTQNISRRDFLKLAGASLGALAFMPAKGINLDKLFDELSRPKRLPQFPASAIIGRTVDPDIDLRNRPTNDPNLNTSIAKLPADTLVEWNREVVGNVIGGLNNQRYVETPQGYIYASVVQPTRNLPNVPITTMPDGQVGFWAEVTVPYVDLTHEGSIWSPWLQDHIKYNFPPRLYYGQVVWIDRIRTDNGFAEYRWNEDAGHGYGGGAYNELYWADGAGLKVLTEEEVAPISPNVDPNDKHIEVDLDFQTLSCYEGSSEVYFCRVSSGLKNIFDPATGLPNTKLATPAGNLLTHWKIISLNMTAGSFQSGYSTPAVPWSTMISGEGIAIHGAFWHNAFGEKRSHGCINVTPEDAKWIFRWTTPYVSLAQSEVRVSLPDHGTIVITSEVTF
ncbi:MAG: L,D-transpeptidase family protein [Anaerolineales bacterium]|nr:L,D-transpeptidase family protein [Anaerolineales bacterium]MCL4260421.1 L,D-transpeptidase [Anaerolineales bacterium]